MGLELLEFCDLGASCFCAGFTDIGEILLRPRFNKPNTINAKPFFEACPPLSVEQTHHISKSHSAILLPSQLFPLVLAMRHTKIPSCSLSSSRSTINLKKPSYVLGSPCSELIQPTSIDPLMHPLQRITLELFLPPHPRSTSPTPKPSGSLTNLHRTPARTIKVPKQEQDRRPEMVARSRVVALEQAERPHPIRRTETQPAEDSASPVTAHHLKALRLKLLRRPTAAIIESRLRSATALELQ